MSELNRDAVLRARETIGGRLHRTPTFSSAAVSERVGASVHLKAELFQRTGSFKPRGVLNQAGLAQRRREAERGRHVVGRERRAGARLGRRDGGTVPRVHVANGEPAEGRRDARLRRRGRPRVRGRRLLVRASAGARRADRRRLRQPVRRSGVAVAATGRSGSRSRRTSRARRLSSSRSAAAA